MTDGSALRVDVLGGFRLFAGGRLLTQLPTARQQQLIAFLVLRARGAPVPRRRCAELLWPDSTDTQALTNLRRELHHLHEKWPDLHARITTGTRTLAWPDDEASVVDVVAFEFAAARGLSGDQAAAGEAAELYRGDLLPDCAAEWIDADRARLRQRATRVLSQLVTDLEAAGKPEDAVTHAAHLTRLDPLDDRAWCALIRCHASRGARAAALHAYQECATVMRRELDVAPSAETRATYRRVFDLEADESSPSLTTPRRAAYPLVGRDTEWQGLLAAWRGANAGRPGLALVRGESGIGKTRLTEELVAWCRREGLCALTSSCYAGEGRLAYAPVASWLVADALAPTLASLDPATLADVARLAPAIGAGRTDVTKADERLEPWQRIRFFEALSRVFRSAAPVILILEDAHWADGDTLAWLQYFLRSLAGSRCLVVATVRAEAEHDNPALGRMLGRIRPDEIVGRFDLSRLGQAATGQLMCAVAERELDAAVLGRAFQDTEGHPLFVVERGRMAMAAAPDVDGAVSAHVQAVLADRLGRLSPAARSTLDVASAVGRDFGFDLIGAAGDLDEDAVVRALDELWARHVIRAQAGGRWDFTHDRLREVAYAHIGPARARRIHRRLAQALEQLFADRLDDVSAALAVHLDRAGQPARALMFLERAVDRATRVSAHEEAIRGVHHGLRLLEQFPPGRDRDDRELALRARLTIVLNAALGYAAPEVEENLERILALLREHGRGQVPARWLWVAFSLRFVLGDVPRACEAAEAVLARSATDEAYRCEAHHAMGAALLSVGDLAGSHRHFTEAVSAYEGRPTERSPLGSDLGVFSHAWFAHTLWLLGEEDRAVAASRQAIMLSRGLDHPYSEALALAYAAILHQMRRDVPAVVECASEAVVLCERHGFAYYGDWAGLLLGWARGLTAPAAGRALIEAALERLDAARALARRPYYLSLLAEVCALAGDRAAAISTLEQAIAMARARSDLWWLPALYCQKSAFESPKRRAATRRAALELARAQGSLALERRILATQP